MGPYYSPPKLKSYGGDRHLLSRWSQCSFFSQRSRVWLSFPISPGFFHLSIHGTLNLMDTWRRVACTTFHSWMASGDRGVETHIGFRENLGPKKRGWIWGAKSWKLIYCVCIREIPGSSKCEKIVPNITWKNYLLRQKFYVNLEDPGMYTNRYGDGEVHYECYEVVWELAVRLAK